MNGVDPSGEYNLVELSISSLLVGLLAGLITYQITGDVLTSVLVGIGAAALFFGVGLVFVEATVAASAGAAAGGASTTALTVTQFLHHASNRVADGYEDEVYQAARLMALTTEGLRQLHLAIAALTKILVTKGSTMQPIVYDHLMRVRMILQRGVDYGFKGDRGV